jgi:hypothetical protein
VSVGSPSSARLLWPTSQLRFVCRCGNLCWRWHHCQEKMGSSKVAGTVPTSEPFAAIGGQTANKGHTQNGLRQVGVPALECNSKCYFTQGMANNKGAGSRSPRDHGKSIKQLAIAEILEARRLQLLIYCHRTDLTISKLQPFPHDTTLEALATKSSTSDILQVRLPSPMAT